MRIVIEADALSLSEYPKAVRTVFQMLGIVHVTKESCVPIQPMYLPSLFLEDDFEKMHPLIASRTDGIAFTAANIEETPDHSNFHKPVHSLGNDAMDYLRPPLPDITLEMASDTLDALDPDMPYPEWLEMAAALKHQFSPAQEREAYIMFNAWSAKGKKYVSAEETEAKWKSLRPSPVGRMPITFRSVLRRAVATGWSSAEVKDICFKSLLNWMATGARTHSSLLAEGLGKIVATPLLSNAEEDALINQIVVEARRRFGAKVTATSLKRDLRAMKQALNKKLAAEQGDSKTPPWANGLAYVSRTHEIFRQLTGERFTPDQCNASFGKWLLPTENQLREAGLPPTTGNLARPLVPPFLYLLNQVKVPVVYDYVYDPSSPDELFTNEGGVTMINTYVRCYPEPNADTGMLAGNMFRRHLENLIAEPEYIRVLLDFLAFMVQCPGQKIRWMILLQGVQGCGKSFIVDAMRVVLGTPHVSIVDCNVLHSQYNDWTVGKQFIAIEEIRVSGQNRHEIMNALKAVISNSHLVINQKFRDPRQVVNRANLIALTNFKDAIVVDDTDRKYYVIQSRMQTKAQVKALGEDYFADLYAMLAENAAGLRWFFENWKISDSFNPNGHAPSTHYMTQLVTDSASEAVAAVRGIIKEQDNPLVRRDLLSSKVLHEMLVVNEGLSRITGPGLAKILRDENYYNVGRHVINDERHYLWTKVGEYNSPLPPEDEARWRVSQNSAHLNLL